MKKNKFKNKENKENKKNLEKLKIFASYISDYIEDFESKDDLIIKLDKLKNTKKVMYASYNINIDSNKSCISFIEALDENNFNLFKKFFIQKINDNKIEQDCCNKLHELLKDYDDIMLIDFAVYSKNYFGIKVQVLDNVYLFDFDGTVNELAKELIYDYKTLSKHKIYCPYCKEEIKTHEYETSCKCGINIMYEISKPNEISYFVEEAGGKEEIKQNGWKVWFLDDEAMKKFEYIEANTKEYFKQKFEDYIRNTKYEHISSDNIVDKKYVVNGIEFTITRSDYFKFISEICLKYCDWVRNGKLYDINFDIDPYYDHSGELVLISEGNMYKNITEFETVKDWLNDCYTGNKRPTHCSGYGFSHDTFSYEIIEEINFEAIIYKKMNITKDDDMYDELRDSDETFKIANEIESVVLDYVEKMTTLQCWNDYNFVVYPLIK